MGMEQEPCPVCNGSGKKVATPAALGHRILGIFASDNFPVRTYLIAEF